VTVETVDNGAKFRLNKSKDKSKKYDSDESDSFESESVTIKQKSKQKKWLYPEKYDSTTPLSIFLTNVKSCAAYNDLTDNDKVAHVRLRLVGTASHVLSGGINAIPTYNDLVEQLEKRFGTKDQSARYRSQLKGRRKKISTEK